MASDPSGAGCIDAGVCRLSIFEHSENAGHREGRHLGDPRGDKAGRPPFGNSSWRAICRIRPGGLKADNAMKVTRSERQPRYNRLAGLQWKRCQSNRHHYFIKSAESQHFWHGADALEQASVVTPTGIEPVFQP